MEKSGLTFADCLGHLVEKFSMKFLEEGLLGSKLVHLDITWHFIMLYVTEMRKGNAKRDFCQSLSAVILDLGKEGSWQEPKWRESLGQRDSERGKAKVIVTCHSSDG